MTEAPPPTPQVPEAVPAPLLSPALGAHLLPPAVRACYGAALLCAPGTALRLCNRHPAGRRARIVVRVLGFRHLAQAMLTLIRPSPEVFAAGAAVDACHAASMLAVAAADPRIRRASIADALAATAFMAVGGLTHAGAADPGPAASARPPG